MSVKANEFKPFELVRVQEEKYAYCGQVVSRETPEGTYMVRRVPGDPSTMEEMPRGKLGKTNKYKYVAYAAVSYRFYFPVDMLRYDFASPVNFKLEEEEGRVKVILNSGETQPIIARVTDSKYCPGWTDARWGSFSSSVEILGGVRLAPL